MSLFHLGLLVLLAPAAAATSIRNRSFLHRPEPLDTRNYCAKYLEEAEAACTNDKDKNPKWTCEFALCDEANVHGRLDASCLLCEITVDEDDILYLLSCGIVVVLLALQQVIIV